MESTRSKRRKKSPPSSSQPPPPQAEGKNILLFPNVESSVPPEPTSTSCSPLIFNITGPEGNSFALAPKSIPTKTKVMVKKTTTLAMITVLSISYNLIPIKLIKPNAINPVMMNVIPRPRNGAGTLE